VGELMLHAVRNGAKRMVVCLGGSATNDGGCGAAAACGVRFFNAAGEAFTPTGGTLKDIAAVDCSGLDAGLAAMDVVTMCDIDNPLCGANGAAVVFGPQKGADAAMIARLDSGLAHLAGLLLRDCGQDTALLSGAGAAGGMGAGMVAFFGSALRPGIETVLDTVGFERCLAGADLVLTGEGKLDSQSLRGKVVVGVAHRARRCGVPTVAVVGDVGAGVERAYDEGVSAVFSINRVAVPYEQARLRAEGDLASTVEDLMRYSKTVLPQSDYQTS
jgi:glycerate kinase